MEDWLRIFYYNQLSEWEFASKNVKSLDKVRKKPFRIGDFKGYIQYNPARAISTMSKTDKNGIKERQCFLCSKNRPKEQNCIDIIENWELLVNPYPILPYHFTIVNKNHTPQKFDFEIGKRLAEKLPEMVVFYNDDGAGASAPDHLHFQSVPIQEVPMINFIENNNIQNFDKLDFPFNFIIDKNESNHFTSPLNAFFWRSKNGEIRFLIIPRKAHRPNYYYLQLPFRRAISPGALDMAGVMVTPFEDDFNRITLEEIKDIYNQVGY